MVYRVSRFHSFLKENWSKSKRIGLEAGFFLTAVLAFQRVDTSSLKLFRVAQKIGNKRMKFLFGVFLIRILIRRDTFLVSYLDTAKLAIIIPILVVRFDIFLRHIRSEVLNNLLHYR